MRVNTRQNRVKTALDRERHLLIEECLKINPSFVPPTNYRAPKQSRKIFLPEDDPTNNYIGIVIGNKGITQKQLEYKSNCRISIRGKGSSQYRRELDSDEKLHVLVQAENEDDVIESFLIISAGYWS